MKIPTVYGRLSRFICFKVCLIERRQASPIELNTSCKTIGLYDDNRSAIIRQLLKEKSRLLKLSFWPWRRDLSKRHKAINLQLEALGVYQGKC